MKLDPRYSYTIRTYPKRKRVWHPGWVAVGIVGGIGLVTGLANWLADWVCRL